MKESQVTLRMNSEDFAKAATRPGVVSAMFSHTDVKRMRVSVWEQGKQDTPLFLNFDMSKDGTGQWAGTLPFLPKNLALTFEVRAFSDLGYLTEIFKGSLDATLTQDYEQLTVPLRPATDGASITLPRIERLTIPSAFIAGQSGNITVAVSAPLGARLHYKIVPATESGSFTPLEGDITLLGTAGAFVTLYTPPETVSATVSYAHKVTVTNEAGHSVSTSFNTRVLPQETSEGAIDTSVRVLFNPVIQGIDGLRVRDDQGGMTSNVLFTATVSDDGAADALTYAWSFTPAAGTQEPLPAFTGQTNPSTLQNYTATLQGTISLAVTDGNNGTTTLTYPLTPNQFPDDTIQEGALTGVKSLRAGENHTCALLNDGTLHCWGYNFYGQLGLGDTQNVGDNEKPSVRPSVKLVGKGTRLAMGANHTCALLDTGLVRCWGAGALGQLGYGNTSNVGAGDDIAKAGYVNLGGLAVKLAAGANHTCALMNTGKVRCWGYNAFGQLGYGNTANVGDDEQPVSKGDVDLGSVTVKDISAGYNHTCALLSTGRLLCWGRNSSGQLGYTHTNSVGNSAPPSSQTPVDVGDVAQLSASPYGTCVLLKTGAVRCWGESGNGQLGLGATTNDAYTGSCRDTTPYACYYRMLAQTSTINLGGTALQIATGYDHACALLSTGAVKCWGRNSTGQLGIGSTTSTNVPGDTVSLGGNTAYQITAGGSHTCAMLSTGAARCWGSGAQGQLGYGNTSNVGTAGAPISGDIEILNPASTPAP